MNNDVLQAGCRSGKVVDNGKVVSHGGDEMIENVESLGEWDVGFIRKEIGILRGPDSEVACVDGEEELEA